MTSALIVAVVTGLGAYRITRLVTTDTLTAGFRRRMLGWFPGRTVPLYDDAGRKVPGDVGTLKARWPVELVNCSWCVGWWAAGGLVAAAWAAGFVDWQPALLTWPASATIAGVVDTWVER